MNKICNQYLLSKLIVYSINICAETVLQLNLRGNSRGILHAIQGDYLNRVHSDQMVLEIVSREAEPHEHWPTKQLEGAIRFESTQIRLFL